MTFTKRKMINDFPFNEQAVENYPQTYNERMAFNVNLILNMLCDHQNHNLNEMEEVVLYCSTIINICRTDTFNVNLYSRNSKIFKTLRDCGYSEEEIFNNKERFFPTICSNDLNDLMQEIIIIFEFLIQYKRGVIDNIVIDEVFTNYKVKNNTNLYWALSEHFKNKYKFGYNTDVEISFDVDDDYMLSLLIKQYRKLTSNSAQKKQSLIMILNESFKFRFNLRYHHLGVVLGKIKNF